MCFSGVARVETDAGGDATDCEIERAATSGRAATSSLAVVDADRAEPLARVDGQAHGGGRDDARDERPVDANRRAGAFAAATSSSGPRP